MLAAVSKSEAGVMVQESKRAREQEERGWKQQRRGGNGMAEKGRPEDK